VGLNFVTQRVHRSPGHQYDGALGRSKISASDPACIRFGNASPNAISFTA